MSRAAHSLQDWTLLILLSLMWGTAFTFTKVAVTELRPATVVAARLAIGAALLLPALRLAALRLPPPGSIWLRFAVLSLFGNALPFFLITWGQQGIDSGLAGTLLASMPLATLFLAHFFVAGERLTPAKFSGFALGLVGVALLLRPAAAGGGVAHQAAVVAGALCYALNAVLARRMPAVHPAVTTAATLLLATAMVLPFALRGAGGAVAELPARAFLALAWLGIVSTATATVVYFRIIAAAGPTFLSLINYLIPIVALLAGALALGERPGWSTLFALAIILAGIALSQLGAAPSPPPSPIPAPGRRAREKRPGLR